MLRSLRAAAVAFSLSLTSVAWCDTGAEPTPAQIRAAAEAFDVGREAYQREDYVSAAEQFERADSQAPSATALEYALRARDKAGQLDRAATLAALAADRHPKEANLAKLSKPVLDRAKKELAEVRVRCAEACELAIGGKIVHGAPSVSRTLFVAPGTVTLRAGFGMDRSVSRDLTVARGSSSQVELELPAEVTTPTPAPRVTETAPIAPSPPEPEASGLSPAVFWIGAGLTVAATAATVWSGVDTLNNPGQDRVRDECARGDTSCALYQQGRESQLRTNVLIGVSAALGVGTILVGTVFTNWSGGGEASLEAAKGARKPKRLAQVRWEPVLEVGQGAWLGARGRF